MRSLAEKTPLSWEELPKGDMHGCCGYGGHVSEANADFYAHVVKSRSALSENPYLVYCINCRDVFRGEGKAAVHVLDLFFDMGNQEDLPGLTQRRHNRTELKEGLLKEIWGETMEKKPEECRFRLKIGEEVQKKMDALKILEEDVCRVIALGEDTNRRTFDPEKDTYSCYRESGYITFWVEYRKACDEYEVVNAYTHRMQIKLEGVWNGRKTEANL